MNSCLFSVSYYWLSQQVFWFVIWYVFVLQEFLDVWPTMPPLSLRNLISLLEALPKIAMKFRRRGLYILLLLWQYICATVIIQGLIFDHIQWPNSVAKCFQILALPKCKIFYSCCLEVCNSANGNSVCCFAAFSILFKNS